MSVYDWEAAGDLEPTDHRKGHTMSTDRTTEPRYPDVTVALVGEDGNAFAILGRTAKALRRAGVPAEEVTAFFDEATAGDYDHLLATVVRWVDAE